MHISPFLSCSLSQHFIVIFLTGGGVTHQCDLSFQRLFQHPCCLTHHHKRQELYQRYCSSVVPGSAHLPHGPVAAAALSLHTRTHSRSTGQALCHTAFLPGARGTLNIGSAQKIPQCIRLDEVVTRNSPKQKYCIWQTPDYKLGIATCESLKRRSRSDAKSTWLPRSQQETAFSHE